MSCCPTMCRFIQDRMSSISQTVLITADRKTFLITADPVVACNLHVCQITESVSSRACRARASPRSTCVIAMLWGKVATLSHRPSSDGLGTPTAVLTSTWRWRQPPGNVGAGHAAGDDSPLCTEYKLCTDH
jgi:hypothetical protein